MACRATPRQYRLALVVVLGSLVSAACAGPKHPVPEKNSEPPVTESPAPVAQSFARYDGLRAELIAALEQQLPGISWTVHLPASVNKLADGRCFFETRTMVSSADVVEPSHRFADIFSAGDPVLAKYGFPAFGGTDPTPGGWTVARSANAAGAIVSIESKSPAYLYIGAPVDSATCDPAELPEP